MKSQGNISYKIMLFLLFFSMPAKTLSLKDWYKWPWIKVHLTDSHNNFYKLYVSFQSFKFFYFQNLIEDSEPPRLGCEVTKRLNFTISIYWQGGTIPKHLDWHRKEEKEHLKGKQNIYFYLLWIFKLFLLCTLTYSHIIKVDIVNHIKEED